MNSRQAVPVATVERAAVRYPVASEHGTAERGAEAAATDTARMRPVGVPWSFADMATRSEDPRETVPVPGSGNPLPTVPRAEMEERFGEDFSAVRVHTGGEATAAARGVDAVAYSVGEHVVLGDNTRDVATPRSRRLVAHELAHVVQARRAPALGQVAHRQKTATATATAADYGDFVDEASRYLEAAASHYRSMASIGKVERARAAQNAGQTPTPKAEQPLTAKKDPGGEKGSEVAKHTPGKADPKAASAPPLTGLTADGLKTALTKLESVYEGSRKTLEQNLPDDAARAARLRKAYVAAASGARAAAVDQTRVNLIIISAPKAKDDWFITNAKTYAAIYYGKGQKGEMVTTITDVDSIAGLFTEIQNASPQRLIGRVDIFAHGTIEPVHLMKLGKVWHRVGEFTQEAEKRAGDAKTLATQSRFDGSTVIELHACRLGADDSAPGKTQESVTHGSDFTKGLASAIGGEQGQSIVAYKERWVPRKFSFGKIDPRKLTGRQRTQFVKEALEIWDAAMAGGTEAQALMTEAERASGSVTKDRKIAIMDQLYLDGGYAWVIGHQYSGKDPVSKDPARDVKTARDTFSNEADWKSKTLEVKVPAPAVTP